jgi:uncharacterized damage-inducible protein DinB
MIRSLNDFVAVFHDEAESTRRVLAVMTDASLKQAIDSDNRTLGRLGWHLAQTIPEMLGKIGLKCAGPDEHASVPASAQAIREGYDTAAKSVAGAIKTAGWTDAILGEKRTMYGGEEWTIAQTLKIQILHEVHHRGEMIVLLRQAGIRPPGLYGPVREDWATYGMEAPAI